MTIEATTRRRSTRASRRDEREEPALTIGETDANIYNCPACARPLDVGATRCPGCRTRLLFGVRLTKAAMFLTAGALAGLLVGSVVTGVGAWAVLSFSPTVITAGPTTPDGRPLASQAAPAAAIGIPSSAVTALRQTTIVNERLLEDAGRLDAALAPKNPSSIDIARILRSIASDAAFGDRVAPDAAVWTSAAPLSADLVSFYAEVGDTARDGLAASIKNPTAYEHAGDAMRSLLARLPAMDAEARDLVASATP